MNTLPVKTTAMIYNKFVGYSDRKYRMHKIVLGKAFEDIKNMGIEISPYCKQMGNQVLTDNDSWVNTHYWYLTPDNLDMTISVYSVFSFMPDEDYNYHNNPRPQLLGFQVIVTQHKEYS